MRSNIVKTIKRDNGEEGQAIFPVIVSASRATDLPAFYADWFFERLKRGYSVWNNPFGRKSMYVGYENTKFIVFWSKNPAPLLEAGRLDYLRDRGIGCYIQFTLNNYDKERLEPNVPSIGERIDTFKRLVDKLGKGAVIWRNDPLIITEEISLYQHLDKISFIGDKLKDYTDKLVFSFVDILNYKKVIRNFKANNLAYHDWQQEDMLTFAQELVKLNESKGWNYELTTCGEKIDLPGIGHNHCVDYRLIAKLGYRSPELRQYINARIHDVALPLFSRNQDDKSAKGYPEGAIPIDSSRYILIDSNAPDKGQREYCGCAKSKDIGQYDTCPHSCIYCYANASPAKARSNWERHKTDPKAEYICPF